MTAPFFVDSFAPLTEDAVAHLLGATGGTMPLAWGRYTDADLSRDFDVAAAHSIPLMLIARRSSRVPIPAAGIPDGEADRARIEKLVEQAVAAGASVVRSVFLDVEQKPTMVADYWRGWSGAFSGARADPCIYMPNRNFWPGSWLALEAAIAAGARCGGAWVALYWHPADGTVTTCDEPWSKRPLASDVIPYLAWQACGNMLGKRYDISVPNPGAMGWLADTIGPAPVPETPCGADPLGDSTSVLFSTMPRTAT